MFGFCSSPYYCPSKPCPLSISFPSFSLIYPLPFPMPLYALPQRFAAVFTRQNYGRVESILRNASFTILTLRLQSAI